MSEWMDDASCLGVNMQPDEATPGDVEQLLQLCTGCPVATQCDELRQSHTPYGVWAGQWYGEDPLWLASSSVCVSCGDAFAGSREQSYCSARCRKRAQRERERATA